MNGQCFNERVAVVTGGNSGIGLGVAKAYAREGASVVITGRDQKTLQAAAEEIGPGTLAIKSDATKISASKMRWTGFANNSAGLTRCSSTPVSRS